jgi:hypothetical protein
MVVEKAAFLNSFLQISCHFLRFTFDFSNEENPCEHLSGKIAEKGRSLYRMCNVAPVYAASAASTA